MSRASRCCAIGSRCDLTETDDDVGSPAFAVGLCVSGIEVRRLLAGNLRVQDLGAYHFDRTSKPAQTKRLIARLQNLGYDVQITPIAAWLAVCF
jgi:hypothetical protein